MSKSHTRLATFVWPEALRVKYDALLTMLADAKDPKAPEFDDAEAAVLAQMPLMGAINEI